MSKGRGLTGPLSPRQGEIAGLVAKGLSNQGIADQLGISAGTVDAHLKRIYAKTGANSRVRLVLWLVERSSGQ